MTYPTEDDEVTLFDSGGAAVETTAVGALLHEHEGAEPSTTVEVSPLSDERARWLHSRVRTVHKPHKIY